MLEKSTFEKLYGEGLISPESMEKIRSLPAREPLNLYWEIRTILYAGVLLVTGGLGLWIYKNLESLGHLVILTGVALLGLGCFVYCFLRRAPFSWGKSWSPDGLFDYLLLLGCLLFLIFIGYWQYAYHVFGDRYGLESFIPMVLFFFCAYYFDSMGVLGLAISNLAAWVGITVTPNRLLKDNDFNSSTLIVTALLLGILLLLAGKLTQRWKIKSHFELAYTNFGLHMTFIASLAGLFHFDNQYGWWLLLLSIPTLYFYRESIRNRSFYQVLVLTLYFYCGMSYAFLRLMHQLGMSISAQIYAGCFYFIGSAIAMVYFLMDRNQKIRQL